MVKSVGVTSLQKVHQEIDSAAFSCTVSDECNLLGRHQEFCNLFIKRCFLGNMFALVLGFFAMDQMMMKAEGIVWVQRFAIFRF